MIADKKRVALIIYSCPFHFPPTINAANLLAEQGIDVHLFGIEYPNTYSQTLNKKVKLIYLDKVQTGLKGLTGYFKSIVFLRRYFKKNKIESAIAYDAKAVMPTYIATRLRRIKWVFHQHDFWEKPKGLWEKFLWITEAKLASYASFVSFPQYERSLHFKEMAGLKEFPVIAFNGPRKNWIDITIGPDPVITELRRKFDYILIYQGGWSAYFGLERIFDALAACCTNTALIMLGEEREKGVRDRYDSYLQKLGIRERVYLAEKYISYDSLPGFTNYADAAIAILTGENDDAPFNNRYLIGASNKITEYIACGLPVLIQDSAPNRRFIEQYPIGILVDSNDKKAFAMAIDELLKDKERRHQLAIHNKNLFEEELNFDNQFRKISEKLL